MNKNIIFWIIIILLVFSFWFIFNNLNKDNNLNLNIWKDVQTIVINWDIWWDKKHFLDDEEVKKILKNKYNLEVKFDVKWSVAMLDNIAWKDFIFPSNKTVWELMKNRNIAFKKRETIFYSPLVAYSWWEIGNILKNQKLISSEWTWSEIINTLDLSWFVNLIQENKNWSDIWWDKNYWNIKIFSTNPVESNSWNMFSWLLFKILNWDMEKIKKVFDTMWLMTWSSWTIFKDFLQIQAWMYQIIIWYENQIIEYYYQNESYKNFIKDNVKVVYLNPTIFADHEIISLSDNWSKLIEALQDEKILEIAWEKYWFRNILSNKKQEEINWISNKTIKNAIPMPNIDDIEKIIQFLK